jgi:cyanophycinase
MIYRWSLMGLLCVAAIVWCQPPNPAPVTGSLMIVGGGKLPETIRERFFKQAGGKTGKIVVIPTASVDADAKNAEEIFIEPWKKLGPASVVLLHAKDAATAKAENFAKPLQEATAVWFSGGDQRRLTKAYLDTPVEAALKQLLARGGIIGGTSAGAAIQSEIMITGGTAKAELDRGFGWLPGFIVDQHFLKRDRFERLAGALAEKPGFRGLGIDESTAAYVTGTKIEIIGDSYALLLTPTPQKTLTVKILKPGDTFDWARKRE